MYTQLGVLTKGTIIEVNVSELGLVRRSLRSYGDMKTDSGTCRLPQAARLCGEDMLVRINERIASTVD
jgi:ribosomal protein S8E